MKVVPSQEFDQWGVREGHPVVVSWQPPPPRSGLPQGTSLWLIAVAAIALMIVFSFLRRAGRSEKVGRPTGSA